MPSWLKGIAVLWAVIGGFAAAVAVFTWVAANHPNFFSAIAVLAVVGLISTMGALMGMETFDD